MTTAIAFGLVFLSGCITSAPDSGGSEAPATPGPPSGAWAWTDAAEQDLPRAEVGCAAQDGILVVVGGFSDPVPAVLDVAVYDLAEDSWSAAPPVPIPLHHTAVAAVEGRFHVLGGYVGPPPFTPLDGHWSWAPGEATWRMEVPLPQPRGAHGAAVVDGTIYLVGGVGLGGLVAAVDAWSNGAWTTLGDMPEPREHLGVTAWRHEIIVTAGRTGGLDSNVASAHGFDAANGTWRGLPDLPGTRGGTGAAAGPYGVFVAGGEAPEGTDGSVVLFDGVDWRLLPEDPTPRHGLCVEWMEDGYHVVFGGTIPGLSTSTVHRVMAPESPV